MTDYIFAPFMRPMARCCASKVVPWEQRHQRCGILAAFAGPVESIHHLLPLSAVGRSDQMAKGNKSRCRC